MSVRSVLSGFLLLNALFWGLATHKTHCSLMANLLGAKATCPPHFVHLTIGIVCFLLTVYVVQYKYVRTLF